jgi:uncharacterized lipoprotein YddW (UPF0748 family)
MGRPLFLHDALWGIAGGLCLFGLTSLAADYVSSSVKPPAPMREFRGAWIATVVNDWPSSKTLSSAEQQDELAAIFDRAANLKLNAIMLQVRPGCDAVYPSQIEPWSEFLTGAMGRAPEPFYDPLAFAIEQAHKRGLELHAWFNPYRARHASARSPVSANHISVTHPELVRRYGKQLWLDPGEKDVQDYSLRVVMDVVKRYDIDGVHFDDYFYPYNEQDGSGNDVAFPDDASWRRFGLASKLSRDDWRRENVNTFIERVYRSVKAAKPWVKFGVSPFGIWRPENPPQIKGYDAYSKLYADSRKWLMNGWVDYLAPQLYWSIDVREQSFPVLLKWWAGQNPKGRHVFAGLDTTKTAPRNYRSDNASKWKAEEIIHQIQLTRKQVSGHIHWNMKSLCRDTGLAELLARETYVQPALTPVYPWLDITPPGRPTLSVKSDTDQKCTLKWQAGGPEKVSLWVVQGKRGREWSTQMLPSNNLSYTFSGAPPNVVAVTAIDRAGNASPAAVLQLKSK